MLLFSRGYPVTEKTTAPTARWDLAMFLSYLLLKSVILNPWNYDLL